MKRFTRFAHVALVGLLVGCSSRGGVRGTAAGAAAPAPAAGATPASDVTVIALGFVAPGSLEVKEVKGEGTAKTKLALERVAIDAKTSGDVAETSVEHVFRNDSDEVLEGTFRFPLPDGAILTGLAMEIDGKLMEGELVERDKARKAYEQVVDQMLDPALLEWENGTTFKLRVFPIEPKKGKRVVLRFVAPLHRTKDGSFFATRLPAPDGGNGLRLEQMAITVDGKRVDPKSKSGDLLVPTGEGAPANVVTETTKDGAYWFAHVHPVIEGRPRNPATNGQALIVLCDRSRSMLEARGLEKQTVGMLLDKLGERDRFTVVTGDVRTRSLGALRDAGGKAAAVEFVDALEPDGASDVAKLLGAAAEPIAAAKAQGLDPVVVFLGDGVATWGETRAAELERIARESIAGAGATMHVVMLGKSTDGEAGRALAAGAHGLVVRPKTEVEAARAAAEIVTARTRSRVDEVHLVGADGLDVPTALPSTLYEGDDLSLVLHGAAAGARAVGDGAKPLARPGELSLVGKVGDQAFSQKIELGSAKSAGHVAQRWAKAKIELLERDGDAQKEAIVKTSLEHGVMSRYTSFLVLDSEEAYAKYQIERKARRAASDEARVSGNIDGDSQRASVSPDHLQPGDPEVRIPAPADARSVVVMFPFGETKVATYEPDESAGHGGEWVVRFLVDRRTPDGSYDIVVRITHHDGRVEILRIPYVVDTQPPNLDVSVTKKRGGAYEIRAKQRLTAEEVEAQSPSRAGTVAERRDRYAHILTDAKRVEVRTPDGQTLALVALRLGEFVGTWTPSSPATLGASAKLRVVAVDRALNESVTEVEVRP